jgi:hypothetical protein
VTERTCLSCDRTMPETKEFFNSSGTKHRGGLKPICRACNRARDRAYYQANKAKFAEYRKANTQRIAAYQAEYMKVYMRSARGLEVHKRAKAKWKAAGGNESIARAAQRRRSRRAGLVSAFDQADWATCLEYFGSRCAYCLRADGISQDHVIPVTSGGGYVPDNIIPACYSCNSRKHCAPMEDWFRKQSFFDEERLMIIMLYVQMAGSG